METAPSPALLSVKEAGNRLGVGRTRAYELVKAGELPVVEFGGRLRVPVAALDEHMERLEKRAVVACSLSRQKQTESRLLDAWGRRELRMRPPWQAAWNQMLPHLSEYEQTVLSLAYGLDDGHPLSAAEVGGAVGISAERARQLITKGQRKLVGMAAAPPTSANAFAS